MKQIFVETLDDAKAAAEGSTLGTWKYQGYKTKKDDIPEINLFPCFATDEDKTCWKDGVVQADAQNLARRLADTPSNHMTPTIFCENAQDILSKLGIQVQAHDKEWAEKNDMHSFLSVSRGSCEPPKFLELSYNNGGSGEPYVFVGM